MSVSLGTEPTWAGRQSPCYGVNLSREIALVATL